METTNAKPRIFMLHGKWHCTSAAGYVYGIGRTPAAAYWAAVLVRADKP